MTEYRKGKAIIRIHPGKLTEEERKVVLEDAVQKFFREVQKKQKRQLRVD